MLPETSNHQQFAVTDHHFRTDHLQKDLGLSPAMLATPIMIANVVVLLAAGFWGWVADRFSRRASMIIPGILSIPLAFWYLLTGDYLVMVVGYVAMGACGGGGMGGPVPAYLNERFPTEIRATATAFVFNTPRLIAFRLCWC